MKLYILSRGWPVQYDSCDEALVAAETEEEARRWHPSQMRDNPDDFLLQHSWLRPDEVLNVRCIGEAAPDVKPGAVMTSWRMG